MAKKPNYVFSKKHFPPNAKRITNVQGIRVWVIGNREFPSRRSYFEWLKNGDPKPKKTQEADPQADPEMDTEVDPEVETQIAIDAGILPEDMNFDE